MQRRLWQVLTPVKGHSSVGFAEVVTIVGLCDLDLIVVKATCPDSMPLSDRYVLQLLKIFSISPSSLHAFSPSFTSRFARRVALKCFVLLHRLLRSVPHHTPFRAELLWARSSGLTSLYPCGFRDASSSASPDYTLFIRSYAQLLPETLDCFSIEDQLEDNNNSGNKEDNEEVVKSLPDKMKEVDRMLEVLPQLQSLMDRVMDCRPSG